MTELTYDSAVAQTVALLNHYGFDLKGYTAEELIAQWLTVYTAVWIRLAAIEALYQGRYKAISVEQILNAWGRRGTPNFHFNGDFERLICRKLPQNLNLTAEKSNPITQHHYSSSSWSVREVQAETEESEIPTEKEPEPENIEDEETDGPEDYPTEPELEDELLEDDIETSWAEEIVYPQTEELAMALHPEETSPGEGEKLAIALERKNTAMAMATVSEAERKALIQSNRPIGELQSEVEEKSTMNNLDNLHNLDNLGESSLDKYNCFRSQAYKQPIGQFKPQADASQCYSKLLLLSDQ